MSHSSAFLLVSGAELSCATMLISQSDCCLDFVPKWSCVDVIIQPICVVAVNLNVFFFNITSIDARATCMCYKTSNLCLLDIE